MSNLHSSLADLSFTAFGSGEFLVRGELPYVVTTARALLMKSDPSDEILIFRDATGEQVDVDLRGPLKQILNHLPVYASVEAVAAEPESLQEPTGPGRPKLGVIPREVTLLPRHWDWLATQPGGASVTLRKLVEEARRSSQAQDVRRHAQEAACRFMLAAAGNLPKYEAATRALFAGQRPAFEKAMAVWPQDIRTYALSLAEKAFVEG